MIILFNSEYLHDYRNTVPVEIPGSDGAIVPPGNIAVSPALDENGNKILLADATPEQIAFYQSSMITNESSTKECLK